MPKVVPEYKAEARARIAEVAERLFVTKGYHRTTMDDVALALGVSKGALYLYYPSKVDLLRQIQAENRRWSRRLMDEALRSADPTGVFSTAFDRAFGEATARDHLALWFELFGEATRDEAIRRAMRDDHREDRRTLRRFFVELQRRGHLPPDTDLDVLTFEVVSLFQGAFWDISVGSDPDRVRDVLRAALNDLFAPGRRARSAGGAGVTRRAGGRRASSAARATRSSGSSR